MYTAAVDDGMSPDGQIVPGIGKQRVCITVIIYTS